MTLLLKNEKNKQPLNCSHAEHQSLYNIISPEMKRNYCVLHTKLRGQALFCYSGSYFLSAMPHQSAIWTPVKYLSSKITLKQTAISHHICQGTGTLQPRPAGFATHSPHNIPIPATSSNASHGSWLEQVQHLLSSTPWGLIVDSVLPTWWQEFHYVAAMKCMEYRSSQCFQNTQ